MKKILFVSYLMVFVLMRPGSYAQTCPGNPFFSYPGGDISYATANANGWCYNGLAAGTHCYSFTQPTMPSLVEIDWNTSGCAACCSNFYIQVNPNISACAGVCLCASGSTCIRVDDIGGSCVFKTYDPSCALIDVNSFLLGSTGSCAALVCGNVYTICFTIPAGCAGMGICPLMNVGTCTVPVELISFNAKCADNHAVKLNWQTASEQNNDYFEVQRKNGMMQVSVPTESGEDWNVAGTIKGAGNSSTSRNYEFTDPLPNGEGWGGALYYRLKQVDFDGQFEIFNMVSVNCKNGNGISVFPNPSSGIFTVLAPEKEFQVNVYSVLGKKIKSIASDENHAAVNLSGYSNGVYLLQVRVQGKMFFEKLMIH